ncbi:MAG: HAD hydrolase-like protein [Acholeplasmataceae bacterium]|nr:HAD hydrolase-like protein [Acholeplasmataceae bacterium]
MIKYIFWDFNGTILDDRELSLVLLNEMLKKQNKPSLSMDQYLDVFGFPIQDYYLKTGISFEHKSFEEMSVWYIAKYQPQSLEQSLHKGLLSTLKILHDEGIKHIVLSASEQNNLIEQVNHYQINPYFDYILGTSDITNHNKEEVGLSFIKEHNIDPKSCLYIGDTIYDFDVAIKMGVYPVLYSGGHQSISRLKQKTSIVINQISDIIKIVKDMEKGE